MRKQTLLVIFFLLLIALPGAWYARRHYHHTASYKREDVYIQMRDGKKLFTVIYKKEGVADRPIMFVRTPYSAEKFWIMNLWPYMEQNYIIAVQDVRGKFMSEGEYENIRPYIPDKKGSQTDEASDTYDSIDWLVKNVSGNNGRVGMTGISYPGFYAALGALCGHPALKAVSPQAPICDWFVGDDIHHNGAFMMMDAVNLFHVFGKYRPAPAKEYPAGAHFPDTNSYKYYLDIGTFRNLSSALGDSIPFWKDISEHPDYDKWWQSRNVANYINNIPDNVATLVVGGMFDAEDCYGALALYKSIERATHAVNKLVMGPWSHGAWSDSSYDHLGIAQFGQKPSSWYIKNVEVPFFNSYLDSTHTGNIAEATIFFTGTNKWRTFTEWPPKEKKDTHLYLQKNGSASFDKPITNDQTGFNEYVSNPQSPVPYNDNKKFARSIEYMTDDQAFAGTRPDVLTYQTQALNEDITLAGNITANIFTSISTTDADIVVKLIDAIPCDSTDAKHPKSHSKRTIDIEMLIRAEVMRGKYRNSLEHPEPFIPGRITQVNFQIPDVAHVFRKGHRIMIQVQSTWFPLVDRNPQQFLDIYKCEPKDYISSNIKIFVSTSHPSSITLPVLAH